jgi:hypothetical protein
MDEPRNCRVAAKCDRRARAHVKSDQFGSMMYLDLSTQYWTSPTGRLYPRKLTTTSIDRELLDGETRSNSNLRPRIGRPICFCLVLSQQWGNLNPASANIRNSIVDASSPLATMTCMAKTLLEKARSVRPKVRKGRRPQYANKQHQDLALAWLDGEITHQQISRTLNISGSNVYNFLCRALQAARIAKRI